MRVIDAGDERAIGRLTARDRSRDPRVEAAAARIVNDVRRRGDAALASWMRRLDGIAPPFALTPRQLRAGWAATPRDVRAAIRTAIRHLERVAGRQRPRPATVQVAAGVRVELAVAPLDRVGCYAPSGRYPLPSTVAMTVVPARVAGVRDVLVACPRPTPAVCCAALEAGATAVLRIGGAQAIAALAYGTRAIPRVDKIAGPGNAYVSAAKSLVSRDCAIDMRAGPSEIVVVSDEGRADWIAADLIAQAEHDPHARPIMITTRRSLAAAVAAQVDEQLVRQPQARASLRANGAIVVARSRAQVRAIVRRMAPEHLVCDRREDAAEFQPAGSVFVGRYSAQATGDYTTGSNHVLPTGGAARARGGLGPADFVRTYTVQTITRRGLQTLGPPAVRLALAEGLSAHAASISRRLESIR